MPGFYDVPLGMVATVVTHLEMGEKPSHMARHKPPLDLLLEEQAEPDLQSYRALFAHIGRKWLWFSRLNATDAELASALHDPQNKLWTVLHEGQSQGILELDFRTKGEAELAFFGLSDQMIGKGIGRWIMCEALHFAWSAPIERLTVHTCTLDSPQALPFYRRCGFTPVRQQIEIAPDPRLTGVLAEEDGPHIPIFPTDA